ncbi:MAG TPA: redoxin domain-containing protein [Abditibacteriaceae bacterium]|jgi:peroxiredoxin
MLQTLTRTNKRVLLGLLAVAGAGVAGVGALNIAPQAAHAAPAGAKAPAFTLKDTAGRTRSLSQFRGRYVVLEWLNHDCPFVKAQYESGNMQKAQRAARAQGAVWLSINSSAAGKQGHYGGAQSNTLTRNKKAAPSIVLLDASGKVGRAYKAKTTPHMFVINPQGKVIYNGAIDNRPTTDKSAVSGSTNYVLAALKQAKSGQKVRIASTQPYGCSVKY